jgi:hypothetical protein
LCFKNNIYKKWSLFPLLFMALVVWLCVSPLVISAASPISGNADMVIVRAPSLTYNASLDISLNNGDILPGWCVAQFVGITVGSNYPVTIYDYFSSYYPDDSALPDYLRFPQINWTCIAYIVNHKQGDYMDIQQAIWHFSDGTTPTLPLALDMVQAANDYEIAHGLFVPGPGQLKPIICDSGSLYQSVFYEYQIPFNSNTTTFLSADTIVLGDSVVDQAAVSGSGPVPTGTVTFEVSENGGITWSSFGTPKMLNNGMATSDPYTPSATDTIYRFRAIYSGDANYSGSQSADQDELLMVNGGEIIILKKSAIGGTIIERPGVTFTIDPNPYGNLPGILTVVDNGSGDTNLAWGIIDLKNVPLGHYLITEITAPAGYGVNPAHLEAIVTNSAPVEVNSIDQPLVPASSTLTTGIMLVGFTGIIIVFELRRRQNKVVR